MVTYAGAEGRETVHPSWAPSKLNSSPTFLDMCRLLQTSFLPNLSFYFLFLFPNFPASPSWSPLNHPLLHTLVGDLALTRLLEEFGMGGVQFPSLHHASPASTIVLQRENLKGKLTMLEIKLKLKKKSVKYLKYHWEKQLRRGQYKNENPKP